MKISSDSSDVFQKEAYSEREISQGSILDPFLILIYINTFMDTSAYVNNTSGLNWDTSAYANLTISEIGKNMEALRFKVNALI